MMKTQIRKYFFESHDLKRKYLWLKLEYGTPSKSEKDRIAIYHVDSLVQKVIHDRGNEGTKNIIIAATDEEFATAAAIHIRSSLSQIETPISYHAIVVLPDVIPADQLSLLKGLSVDIVRAPVDSVGQFAKKLADHSPHSYIISEAYDMIDIYKPLLSEIKEQNDEVKENEWRHLVLFIHSMAQFDALYKSVQSNLPQMGIVGVSFNKQLIDQLLQKYRESPLQITLETILEKDAYAAARKAMATNGLTCGIRSGACLAFVTNSNYTFCPSETLCIIGDDAEKYASTLLNEEWLVEHELFSFSNMEKKYRGASVEDLQLPEAVCVYEADPVGNALDLMISRDFSQLPVINAKRKIVGFLTLSQLQNTQSQWKPTDPVKQCMHAFSKSKPYKLITPGTALRELESFFDDHSAAVVTDDSGKFVLGLVTKIDLLKFLIKRT